MKPSLLSVTTVFAALLSVSAASFADNKSTATAAKKSDLTITVKPVAESTGYLMLALYDSAESFRKKTVHAIRQPAVTGDMTVTIPDLPHGTYAVMAFQDLNDNGKLDTNLIGIPKEPWGGSLQGKTVFGAPGWSDTRFDVTASQRAVTIELN